jgi:hypothetical protein
MLGSRQQRKDAAGALGIAVDQQEAQCVHIGFNSFGASALKHISTIGEILKQL